MIEHSPSEVAALKQAVRNTDISIFYLYFNHELQRRIDEGVDPAKPYDQLLTEVVDSVLRKNFPGAPDRNMFSEVLEAYKSSSPLTAQYSPVCRQALDLYILEVINQI